MSAYSKPVYIVEEMAAVVAKVATKLATPVYYMYGHPLEIVGRLQEKANSTTMKATAFPLVCLFTDIPEDNGDNVGFYAKDRLNIVICTSTTQTYTSEERTANTFKPILYPIKVELLKQITAYPNFTVNGELKFRSWDRYFWGRQGLYGSVANPFNDYIDAIEIQNLQITIKNKIC